MTSNHSILSRWRHLLPVVAMLLGMTTPVQALSRQNATAAAPDTLPLLRGVSVYADLVGPAMLLLSDYGQYEFGARVNLRNRYLPTVEAGLGRARHANQLTSLHYETTAPFFKAGMDFNVLKNKESGNLLFVGFRYAFTYFSNDISDHSLTDPVWKNTVDYTIHNSGCYYHWFEGVFGLDTPLVGPVHLGWSVRWRRRLFHNEGDYGRAWYVPGFGPSAGGRIAAMFNFTIKI